MEVIRDTVTAGEKRFAASSSLLDWSRVAHEKNRSPRAKGARGKDEDLNFRLPLRLRLVAGDHTVFDMNDAVRVSGDVVLVRDQDDGVAFGVQTVEQCHDLRPGLRVEV